MADAALEDFRGKDCVFVANWLQGKGLGFECVKVCYCCVYSEIQYLYRRFNTTT